MVRVLTIKRFMTTFVSFLKRVSSVPNNRLQRTALARRR
jgi:hypothetical protein